MTQRWREAAPRRKGLVELPAKRNDCWVARKPRRARIRESYENRSIYCGGVISRSRPGPRATSVKRKLSTALF